VQLIFPFQAFRASINIIYNPPPNSQPRSISQAQAAHLTTFSTQPISTLRTSLLKVSTSSQQSSGRLSFTLRQLITPSLAFTTPWSISWISVTFFLASSFFRSDDSSFCTLSRPRSRSASPAVLLDLAESLEGSSDDRDSVTSLKVWSSRAWRRFSSSATRAWMCSSRVLARVESLCGNHVSLCSYKIFFCYPHPI